MAKEKGSTLSTKGMVAIVVSVVIVAAGIIGLWIANRNPEKVDHEVITLQNPEEFFTAYVGRYIDELGVGPMLIIDGENSSYQDYEDSPYTIMYDHGESLVASQCIESDENTCIFHYRSESYDLYYRFHIDGTYLYMYWGKSVDSINETIGVYKYNNSADDSEEIKAAYNQNAKDEFENLWYGTYYLDLTYKYSTVDYSAYSEVSCTIYYENEKAYMTLEAKDLQGNSIISIEGKEMVITGERPSVDFRVLENGESIAGVHYLYSTLDINLDGEYENDPEYEVFDGRYYMMDEQ